jgi:voltage-gated potassium channel
MEDGQIAITQYPSLLKRAIYSATVILAILVIGTLAFHYVENFSYVNAFFFMSMLATGEGPPFPPVTALGKILASVMAFVSVGAVITSLIFITGPFIGTLIRAGEKKLVMEERIIVDDIKKYKNKKNK